MVFRVIISLFLIVLIFPAKAQEIVVNEYFNAADQNDEWTELVVVQDNLDLTGWFIGDNNQGTSSWQPKIKFKDNPLWKNLRAGTIIQLDHAANLAGCNDITDSDKSDGFIRVCVRNSTYFEGGSSTTLFLADDGDFVHIINPSGKMVHGIGHDDNPGNSVEGGTCFNSSPNWTNTTSAKPATRPCGNFLFYRFNMVSPTSLFVRTGVTADFFAGMQASTSNGFIDTIDTPFEGIGNAGGNAAWVVNLRKPIFQEQTVCLTKTGSNTTLSFSWDKATDPFPSDGTIGYMVLRNQTENFPLPLQGTQYALNQTIGTGVQASLVVGLINSSQTTTFQDDPGVGTFHYRVYAFRYVNTTGFSHFTRGRTYNTEQFITVAPGDLPSHVLENDTLCGPGVATLRAFLTTGQSPNWYTSPTTPNPILTNQDTLRILVNENTSYWIGLGGPGQCITPRVEVKAVIAPFDFSYTASDSICEGTAAYLSASYNSNWTYDWRLLNAPSGVSSSPLDSNFVEIQVPYYPVAQTIRFSIRVFNEKGCPSPIKVDSMRTVPFNPQLVASNISPLANESVTVSISPPQTSTICYSWTNSGGSILSQAVASCQVSTPDSMSVTGILGYTLPNDAPFCRVSRSVLIHVSEPILPISNVVTANGDGKNDILDFGGREVKDLEVYDRWGKQVFSGGSTLNPWKGDDLNSGLYFFKAVTRNPGKVAFEKQNGWVLLNKD